MAKQQQDHQKEIAIIKPVVDANSDALQSKLAPLEKGVVDVTTTMQAGFAAYGNQFNQVNATLVALTQSMAAITAALPHPPPQ